MFETPSLTEPEDDARGGDLLVWILAWSELAAFGALLTAFVVVSWLQPTQATELRGHLLLPVPILNTGVLLASGWMAAMAASQGPDRRRRLALLGAAAGGLAFVVLKIVEYRMEGAVLLTDQALPTLYILITGFHLAHVAFGAGVLTLLARYPDPQNIHLMTTLWHVIDVVWLIMLPVIYLI